MGIGNNITAPAETPSWRGAPQAVDPTKAAFFWLSAFFVVYCARPEDWVPGLNYIPVRQGHGHPGDVEFFHRYG